MEKKIKPAKGRIKELWQIRKDVKALLMAVKNDQEKNEERPHHIIELRQQVIDIDKEIQSYSHNYHPIRS